MFNNTGFHNTCRITKINIIICINFTLSTEALHNRYVFRFKLIVKENNMQSDSIHKLGIISSNMFLEGDIAARSKRVSVERNVAATRRHH